MFDQPFYELVVICSTSSKFDKTVETYKQCITKSKLVNVKDTELLDWLNKYMRSILKYNSIIAYVNSDCKKENEEITRLFEKHRLTKMDKKLKYITEKLVKYNWATYPHRCLLVLDDFASHPLIRSKETEMCRLLKKLRHFNINVIICVQTVKSIPNNKHLPEPVDLTNYYDKQYIKENYVDYNALDNTLTSYCYSKADIEDGMYWSYYIDEKFALKTSIPDMTNYVLRTDYEELQEKITLLEQENTLLKKQVYSLTPHYPWSVFYKNYEEITNLSGYPICYYFFYTYNPTNGTLTISFMNIKGHTFEKRNYLCVLIVNNPAMYYVFRISLTDKKVYVNEYKGSTQVILFTSYSITLSEFGIQEITSTNTSIRYRFDYVFWQEVDP